MELRNKGRLLRDVHSLDPAKKLEPVCGTYVDDLSLKRNLNSQLMFLGIVSPLVEAACCEAAKAAAAVADSTIMRSILILSPATDSMARRSAIATARCNSAMAARFTFKYELYETPCFLD